MQLDKLILDLRPRSHREALDLGPALLRSCGQQVYACWLVLWLGTIAVTMLLQTLVDREYAGLLVLLPWLLKPALERGPLFILSRAVFGETVSWRQALRAWPKQLGGGMLYLLTIGRLLMPARGLYQAVWMLEGARGRAATQRQVVLARDGTGGAAAWYTVICAHLEGVIQMGAATLIGLFLAREDLVNPWEWMVAPSSRVTADFVQIWAGSVFVGISGAIMGPVYVASSFTLYLNRRATLEAWDIEIMLRQLPATVPSAVKDWTAGSLLVLPLLLAAALLTTPATGWAAGKEPYCTPDGKVVVPQTQGPANSPEQARLRAELKTLYADEDLRRHYCTSQWQVREFKPKKSDGKPPSWLTKFLESVFANRGSAELIAFILKMTVIGVLLCLVALALYRFRHQLPRFSRRPRLQAATEVAGLDIRPESLPDDIPGAALQLWRTNQRREALGLLYRATLSRLVQHDGLHISIGATEGDCLKNAGRVAPHRLPLLQTLTTMWLGAAWGRQWPTNDDVEHCCHLWAEQFERGAH